MKIIITESQYKFLLEQQKEKAKVTDYCGRTNEFDHQIWYYDITKEYPSGKNYPNPRADLKCYKRDGTSYKFNNDWSCYISGWSSKTKEQQEAAIKSIKYTCTGNYRENPNLVTAAVKSIESFAVWFPQTIQEWVDWITWFLESFGGPQGKVIATMSEAIQGIGYLMFAESQKTLKDYVKYVVEGVSKLFSAAKFKTKVPGLSDWLDRIVKYVEGIGFGSIISTLASQGAKINTKFDAQPKAIQAVITLLVQAGGTYVSQGINWVVSNIMTPLYNLIKQYNETLAEYIKGFIGNMNLFLSLVDTASLIVTDLNKKGILTKIK